MKIIKNWLFINHLWLDAKPCPIALNLNNVTQITEECDREFGGNHVVIYTNDGKSVPVEGELIEVLALLQDHLSNN